MKKMIELRNLFLFSLLFMLLGCQATTGYYRGALAPSDTVASLPDETGIVRHWEDLYAVVDYSWRQDGKKWIIDGVFKFSDRTRGMMARVDDFDLKFFFLNQEQRVLEYFDLVWVAGAQLNREADFSHTVVLPEGAAAVSFGYEGKLVDEEGFVEKVWKLPLRAAE
ncbi:hypothetical protein SAMN02745165_03071 [Malonomonas rubra DSM 5091]|uniref:Lipoprotein n=1 Tax=Malonomonas rubra DSM 5091 TaxID=1122189 RepID=A0A1M6LSP7_MALRU|nr:hypothetical protein [Malonomonas rubra]SHJ74175.1 hypothetical protein SAMN02745165_03071 [Malonomonas rubra DSM 5091]